MPSPYAVVDLVREVGPIDGLRELPDVTAIRASAAPLPAVVRLAGGQVGLLNRADPRYSVWANVLESLRDAGQPAYVEIDPATRYITELLVPLRVRVGGIVPNANGVEVELIISHARHYLRRGTPHFQEMLEALQTAQREGGEVLVAETLDEHVMIDVRPAPTAQPAG